MDAASTAVNRSSRSCNGSVVVDLLALHVVVITIVILAVDIPVSGLQVIQNSADYIMDAQGSLNSIRAAAVASIGIAFPCGTCIGKSQK